VIDAGACPSRPTTVVDMTGGRYRRRAPGPRRHRPSWAYEKPCLRQSTRGLPTDLLQTILIYALPVLFAITVHEAAHGYAARHFGDNTAAMMGRITLNPLKHIDPVGTILMPLLLYFATSGAFLFGYAKPVPVRFGKLRNPKRDMIWVALAGPGANLAQAMLWGVSLLPVCAAIGVTEPFFLKMCQGGILVNVVMFVFNLFPLPPLDGGRILVGLLPYKQAMLVSRVEPWGFFIVMALVVSGVVSALWMQPLMGLTYGFIETRAHAAVLPASLNADPPA
jgi:Zn-dependent protease